MLELTSNDLAIAIVPLSPILLFPTFFNTPYSYLTLQ